MSYTETKTRTPELNPEDAELFSSMLMSIHKMLRISADEFSNYGKFELCSSFSKSGMSERFTDDKAVRIVRFFAGDRPVEADKEIVAAVTVQEDISTATEYVIYSNLEDSTGINVECYTDVPRHGTVQALGRMVVPVQRGSGASSLIRKQKEAQIRRTNKRNESAVTKPEQLEPLYAVLCQARGVVPQYIKQ